MTYSVYRGTRAHVRPGRANRIATGVTGTSFADTAAVQSGVTYYYLVRAMETGAAVIPDENTVVRSARSMGASAT